MNSVKNMTNSVEPNGSALAVVDRPYGTSDYRVMRDVVVSAMPRSEALEWVKARNPRLRGAPLGAVLYFLTRRWELRAGWHVGARRMSSWHSIVAWGEVDALGRFVRKADDTGWFSATAAYKVLELIAERINEVSTLAAGA